MKKLPILSFFLIMSNFFNAQQANVEFRVHYEMTYNFTDEQKEMDLDQYVPSIEDVYYKNGNVRTEIDRGPFSAMFDFDFMKTIFKLKDSDTTWILYSHWESGFGAPREEKEAVYLINNLSSNSSHIVHSDQTKTILGYKCKHVTLVNYFDDGSHQKIVAYYTEFLPNPDESLQINGLVLELYNFDENNKVIRTKKATDISFNSLDNSLFAIPEPRDEWWIRSIFDTRYGDFFK